MWRCGHSVVALSFLLFSLSGVGGRGGRRGDTHIYIMERWKKELLGEEDFEGGGGKGKEQGKGGGG